MASDERLWATCCTRYSACDRQLAAVRLASSTADPLIRFAKSLRFEHGAESLILAEIQSHVHRTIKFRSGSDTAPWRSLASDGRRWLFVVPKTAGGSCPYLAILFRCYSDPSFFGRRLGGGLAEKPDDSEGLLPAPCGDHCCCATSPVAATALGLNAFLIKPDVVSSVATQVEPGIYSKSLGVDVGPNASGANTVTAIVSTATPTLSAPWLARRRARSIAGYAKRHHGMPTQSPHEIDVTHLALHGIATEGGHEHQA